MNQPISYPEPSDPLVSGWSPGDQPMTKESFVCQTTDICNTGEPLYNEVLGITNDILQPGQSNSEKHGKNLGITKSSL